MFFNRIFIQEPEILEVNFADKLSKFDSVILLDIYPARELPIEGITSKWLLEKIENPNKILSSKEGLIQRILDSKSDVVITMGAGDIGEEVLSIKQRLQYEEEV